MISQGDRSSENPVNHAKYFFNLWLRLMSRVKPVNTLFQTRAKGNDVISNVTSSIRIFCIDFLD